MPLDTVPPPPPPPSITSDQPLPPGVDPTDAPYVSLTPAPQHKEKRDSFGSELDSFYSDIAMIEATSTTETKEITPQEIQTENIEVPIKKKKKKVCLLKFNSSFDDLFVYLFIYLFFLSRVNWGKESQ